MKEMTKEETENFLEVLRKKEECAFKKRSFDELRFVESIFPGCMALTFDTEKDWLEKRKEFLCASDTPCILGVGFRSNVSIWEDKCDAESVRKRKPASEMVERSMRLGKMSEPLVRSQIEVDHSLTVFDGTNILVVNTNILDKNGNPFLAATLDGVMIDESGNPIIVEIKRTESWTAFGATPPIGYRAQVLKQMLVTGANEAILVARTVKFYANGIRQAKEDEYKFSTSEKQDKYDMECIRKVETMFWENYVLGKKKPDLQIAEPEGK